MSTRRRRRVCGCPPGGENTPSRPPPASASTDRGAGACDGISPQRVEALRRVHGGRMPFPVRFDAPVHPVPGRWQVPSGQVTGKVDVLHVGQVLEQPAQGHGRGADASTQARRVEVGALPGQGGALPLQRPQQGPGLVPDGRRFRISRLVHISHQHESYPARRSSRLVPCVHDSPSRSVDTEPVAHQAALEPGNLTSQRGRRRVVDLDGRRDRGASGQAEVAHRALAPHRARRPDRVVVEAPRERDSLARRGQVV